MDIDMGSIAAELAIRRAVLGFYHRDRGNWEALRALFTSDAEIRISWYRGSIDGFIEGSKAMAKEGRTTSRHLINPPRVDVAGLRAVADSDVEMIIRMPTDAGELDVRSWIRFLDLLKCVEGQWLIAKRTAIYELDRIDPVVPGTHFDLRGCETFPPAYKHVAFLLNQIGRELQDKLPTAGDAEEAAVYEEAAAWLGGH